jgi:hypothetical protein
MSCSLEKETLSNDTTGIQLCVKQTASRNTELGAISNPHVDSAKEPRKKRCFVCTCKGFTYTGLHCCIRIVLLAFLLLRCIFVVNRETRVRTNCRSWMHNVCSCMFVYFISEIPQRISKNLAVQFYTKYCLTNLMLVLSGS